MTTGTRSTPGAPSSARVRSWSESPALWAAAPSLSSETTEFPCLLGRLTMRSPATATTSTSPQAGGTQPTHSRSTRNRYRAGGGSNVRLLPPPTSMRCLPDGDGRADRHEPVKGEQGGVLDADAAV